MGKYHVLNSKNLLPKSSQRSISARSVAFAVRMWWSPETVPEEISHCRSCSGCRWDTGFHPAQMRLDVCWRACGYSILPVFCPAHFELLHRHLRMWVGTVGGRFCRMHPRCAAAQIRPKELKCLQQQLLGMFVIKVYKGHNLLVLKHNVQSSLIG